MELGDYDVSGRRRPIPVKGSEFVLEVDTIIPEIGYKPELTCLPSDRGLMITKRERSPVTRSRWRLKFLVSLPQGMW